MNPIRIGSRWVGNGFPCLVIAEIGINHNGSVEIAKQLIDVAVDAGCEMVKFQKRTIDVVYTQDELAKLRAFDRSIIKHAVERSGRYGYSVLGSVAEARLHANPEATTNGDLKLALEFNQPEYREIDAYCRERGIMWCASPWDEASVDFLEQFNPVCYKLASASITDRKLLEHVRSKGRPVILSTGMSTMEQVLASTGIVGDVPLVILHCNSTYPTADEDENLRVITTLQNEFPFTPIGYSGHGHGTTPSVATVALGASVIERHITLDRAMPGSDQSASLEPSGIKHLVHNVRRLEKALGDGMKRVTPAEVAIAAKLRRKTDF
ncbi:MAG: N-acetylneuraminate synthase family protein [Candidatus Pacebacteria bacterium]|nr:N-acetylneuraminate synthase family protein [Candidatus Paceibacterota bacterium]